jgi:hypothetical protein
MGNTTAAEREVVERFGALDRLLGVAASSVRPDGLSAHAAEEIQDVLISITKRATGLQTLIADRAAEGSGWRGRGARTPAEDLANRSGTSQSKAKATLDASKRVKKQPKVADALAAGELSGEQASLITDAADANPDAEAELLAASRDKDLNGLRDACGRLKAAADKDPDGTRARLHRERYLRYGKNTDGGVSGSFKLAPDAAARFDARFRPLVDAEAKRAAREDRDDTIDQLSADALVAMAEATGDGSTTTTPTQVNIIVDHEAMLRGRVQGDECCEYTTSFGAMPVPVSVVQEILDDAFLVGLFHDGTDIASVIRWGRHVPAAVKDALRVRDDFTCSHPGCHRRARVQIDHTLPFGQDNPTSYDNLGLLCSFHHAEKTKTDNHTTRAFKARRTAPPRAGPAP